MSKEDFESYAIKKGGKKGVLQKNTAGNYSSALKKISEWVRENNIQGCDFDREIIDIVDLNEFKKIYESCMSNESFLRENKKTHNRWRSSLNMFKYFLEDTVKENHSEPTPQEYAETPEISLETFDEQDTVHEIGGNFPQEVFVSGYHNNKLYPMNLIYFGAPGTGKSHNLNVRKNNLLNGYMKDEFDDSHFERVTFHPNYSYSNFVGAYKPVMTSDWDNLSEDTKNILNALLKDDLTADDYDELVGRFPKSEQGTLLNVLLSMYRGDKVVLKAESDGISKDVSGEGKNIGKALREYVKLYSKYDVSGDISYEFVPGPFIRLYVNAVVSLLNGKKEPHLLLIEEINRAEVAAVFGDVFQLLDRNDDNRSMYEIKISEDLKRYLKKELARRLGDEFVNKPEITPYYTSLCIPDNMFIWATMNSADQGVFPMDTAFKRRWEFEYMDIDSGEDEINDRCFFLKDRKTKLKWNTLRKAINNLLAGLGINEDKQMGAFFISNKILSNGHKNDESLDENGVSESDWKERDKPFVESFKNKVIMYLFDDAARQRRESVFDKSKILDRNTENSYLKYSDICKAFDGHGYKIFVKDVRKYYEYYENPSEE